jgi:hypothetical protein
MPPHAVTQSQRGPGKILRIRSVKTTSGERGDSVGGTVGSLAGFGEQWSGAREWRADSLATLKVTWKQALAWRMKRHMLDLPADWSVAEVVERLCGVQAQVASSAELAIRLRRRSSRPGEVDQALTSGRLLKTWAMRGALHLLPPEAARSFLALMAAGRSWERPSWQRYFGVSPEQIEALRRTVRHVLEGAVLTREELVEAVVRESPDLAHVGEALGSGWGTLLKPIAWQGDLCFGPSRANRVTFMLPAYASPGWGGILPLEEAAPAAIIAYLSAYGPATIDGFGAWLAGGWFGRRRLRGWFDDLGPRLVEIDVEGRAAWLLAEDLDELTSTPPTRAVRLLGGFDQYVLGPGTADPHLIPPGRRGAVSRQSGWISPVVLAGGVVAGTWELQDGEVRLGWFEEAGRVPRRALEEEVARLASVLDLSLRLSVDLV